ncbi:hypothetical protein O6P43_013301 [Quillaja saponaria]|uniref:Uncharacterized protein n=1 Tax=Quillaja saponaria TaxID=32244 RepID=A0AAD7M3L0_QUISA|nr:hypothetical protein O6P43_013301 [Quillaja saponaria]
MKEAKEGTSDRGGQNTPILIFAPPSKQVQNLSGVGSSQILSSSDTLSPSLSADAHAHAPSTCATSTLTSSIPTAPSYGDDAAPSYAMGDMNTHASSSVRKHSRGCLIDHWN